MFEIKKEEKIYLTILIISIFILIFINIYYRNRCPECKKMYSIESNRPIIVYKI